MLKENSMIDISYLITTFIKKLMILEIRSSRFVFFRSLKRSVESIVKITTMRMLVFFEGQFYWTISKYQKQFSFSGESWRDRVEEIGWIRQCRSGDREPDDDPVYRLGRSSSGSSRRGTTRPWPTILPNKLVCRSRTGQTDPSESRFRILDRWNVPVGRIPGRPSMRDPCGTSKCCSTPMFL